MVTLLMTARADVNVSGDSIHGPACCSQSREAFPGRAAGTWTQGGRGMDLRWAGYRCKEGRPSFIKTVIISSTSQKGFLTGLGCLGGQCSFLG